MEMNKKMKDVHTEHCCVIHGCKYNDKDCTVVAGKAVQSHPCEDCIDEERSKSIAKSTAVETLHKYIQWNVIRGDSIIWGSDKMISFSVKQLEEIAEKIAERLGDNAK